MNAWHMRGQDEEEAVCQVDTRLHLGDGKAGQGGRQEESTWGGRGGAREVRSHKQGGEVTQAGR